MPIYGICGLPGAGKTLFAVRMMWQTRKQAPNRALVSNTPLYFPGEPVEVIDGIEDCFTLSHCTLLLDEMHLLMGSRDWKEHGKQFAEWISQLRKVDVDLWYTSQDMTSLDKLVRARTFLTYSIESFRRLGFMWYRVYFGSKEAPSRQFRWGWYWFSPLLASMYDTDWKVHV